jgi:hypothetical protein
MKNKLTLTRSDLIKMLDEMDKNNADKIKLDIDIDCDYEIRYIDFDIYHDTKYINTVLTLE